MKVLLSSGGAFWGLTAAFVALFLWLGYNYLQVKKSGMKEDGTKGNTGMKYFPGQVPFLQNKFTPYLGAITVLYFIALAFVYSDYRPAKAKDGVPMQQTDSSRLPAEDFPK